MNNLAHSTDQLFSTSSVSIKQNRTKFQEIVEKIAVMDDAYGIVQHHDAIAGTEKQHVAEDYAVRLAMGQASVQTVISELINQKLGGKTQFSFCPLLNESKCEATTSDAGDISIVFYNPIGWTRNEFIRIPINSPNWKVFDYNSLPIDSQIIKSKGLELLFRATIPPLGYSTYFLRKSSKRSFELSNRFRGELNIENDIWALTFSPSTGLLSSITNKSSKKSYPITQNYFWYQSSVGDKQNSQASGAYIFRPNGFFPVSKSPIVNVFTNGSLVQEVNQRFSPWLSQSIRLYKSQELIEFRTTVNAIDVSDGIGKEVITRFSTGLQTQGKWFTDSQGIEMIERIRDKRPWPVPNITEPISWNYVPMNDAAFISDGSTKLTVITDRSRGCASLRDGEIESMIQRRTLRDDRRGVGEPLNGTETVTTSQWISFNSAGNAPKLQRTQALLRNNPPIILFSRDNQDWSKKKLYWSALNRDIPDTLRILNLRTLSDGSVLFRIHHLYSKEESASSVQIDIQNLFSEKKISSIQEVSLSANRILNAKASTKIMLRPTEIKSFLLQF
eukprot:TRINITY_DN3325_c0_g2_i1.p1 TRINITY_DN3325_c0_g2~~TRINITY_DN3325_c0_g2_i1.p1  ORF type:complete len:559 (-),score=163.49 TRINITY_DN3325_c0_g2_i1:736-2412(-)